MLTHLRRAFDRATETEKRLLALAAALLVIWIGFHLLTGGLFLTLRNVYNLAVQSSTVGVLSVGMVLVIATKNIDLSVGSILGFVGITIAFLQIEIFPADAPWNWPLTVLIGLALGTAIGLWQGFLVACVRIPSFVVTLAGLLIFRGAAFEVTQGQTLSPFEDACRIFGSGTSGSLGETASWAIAALALAGIAAFSLRQARAHPADRAAMLSMAAFTSVFTVFSIWMFNACDRPQTEIGHGVPSPILILAVMAGLAILFVRHAPFGRHVFTVGQDIENARLVGVPTRRVILKVFAVMGALCAVGAIITTSRLNAGTTNLGTLLELNVIAASRNARRSQVNRLQRAVNLPFTLRQVEDGPSGGAGEPASDGRRRSPAALALLARGGRTAESTLSRWWCREAEAKLRPHGAGNERQRPARGASRDPLPASRKAAAVRIAPMPAPFSEMGDQSNDIFPGFPGGSRGTARKPSEVWPWTSHGQDSSGPPDISPSGQPDLERTIMTPVDAPALQSEDITCSSSAMSRQTAPTAPRVKFSEEIHDFQLFFSSRGGAAPGVICRDDLPHALGQRHAEQIAAMINGRMSQPASSMSGVLGVLLQLCHEMLHTQMAIVQVGVDSRRSLRKRKAATTKAQRFRRQVQRSVRTVGPAVDQSRAPAQMPSSPSRRSAASLSVTEVSAAS